MDFEVLAGRETEGKGGAHWMLREQLYDRPHTNDKDETNLIGGGVD
jgi:hypothetical protein